MPHKPPIEIERKFLIKLLPKNLNKYPHEKIVQGYIVANPKGTEVRLRKKGNKYYQTIKEGKKKVTAEYEVELTRKQFDSLWNAAKGRTIEKTRYLIPYQKLTIELDVYRGSLKGFSNVEVEFKSEKDFDKFIPPNWFGADITFDERYLNSSLVLYGVPKK